MNRRVEFILAFVWIAAVSSVTLAEPPALVGAGRDSNAVLNDNDFELEPIVPNFVNVTNADIADAVGHGRGASWVDYDGDGDLDLYVTNWTLGPNRLHRNNGDGTFTWITGTPLDDSGFGGRATWADFDNDGDSDLYLVNSGANKFFRNEGGGAFTDITSEILADGGLSRCAAWGDYNNDGYVDLYLTVSGVNFDGDVNVLFHNLAGTALSLTAIPELELPERVGRGIAWSDFDNDGDLDMYVANGGPPDPGPKDPPIDDTNALIRNDGGGAFTEITTPALLLQDNSRSVTWADFDNDGDMDLYVTTGSAGANSLFENTPEGFIPVDDAAVGGGGRTRDAAWGDYDNDGDLDLYLSRLFENVLLENDGNGNFTDVTVGELGSAANGRGVVWGDYDNDGDLDLFNATSLMNMLFRNDTVTENHWLKVKLTGVITNRDAIGARIFVRTGARNQMREVTAGEGYLSHRPLIQHFGLGHFTLIDEVRVVWPASGREQHFFDVVADQTLFITEPGQSMDFNDDGEINGVDLAMLLSLWGTSDGIADVNNDGVVDGADLATLLSVWGTK